MTSENGSQLLFGWLEPHGPNWTAGAGKRLHDNPWFGVDHYDAVAPTGAPAHYYVHDQKAVATGCLPLYDDGTVLLVGQWRFPFGAYSWEMPEGGSLPPEIPLEGCKRELAEEAGLHASDWREVIRLQLSNASSNEVAVCYLATGLSPTRAASIDHTEDLAIARVPFREALAAALQGHIQDAMTVATLLRVHHMAVMGELDPSLAQAVLS
jgi:8-oxo-dGTP pyrophosphatase MutT (NUDIX family)